MVTTMGSAHQVGYGPEVAVVDRTEAPDSPGSEPSTHPWLTASRWIMLMLVLSTVTWRASDIYGGGIDVVVAAKAVLACLALALAWAARVNSPVGRPMGGAFVWLLVAYVTVSTFGAWTAGELAVSGVLSVRLLLVGATVILLVKTFSAHQLLRDLMAGMAVIALVGAVTGIPNYIADGRLSGGVPGMHSNELSLLCALPVIGGIYLVLTRQAKGVHLLILGFLLIALVLTGSRTAVLTVVLAVLVMLPQAKRLSPVVSVLLIACIPLTIFIMLGTDTFQSFFDREGEGDIATLNSRSIVWSAALDYPPTEWVRWLGTGLATKELPVQGQYWDTQVLDSSWVSALVQAGWLGVVLLLGWAGLATAMTLRMTRGPRMLTQALLVALISRSVVESGLMDSSPAFLTFALIAFIADRGPSERRFPRRTAARLPTYGASRGATSSPS